MADIDHTGRWVDGDNADIDAYETLRDDVKAFNAANPSRVGSHLGTKPQRPVYLNDVFGTKRVDLGTAPYDVAGPARGALQGAYDFKTLPLYATPLQPFVMGADVVEGVANKNPLQALGAVALGPASKTAKRIALPALGTTTVTSDAEGAGLDKVAKPWYSRALAAMEGLTQPKATPTQYINTMLNKGNVAKEELEWALKNLPREKPVTLDELRTALKDGVPQPDEVLKGSGKFGTRDAAEWQRDIDAAEQAGDWDAAEALQREWEGLGADGSTRNMTAYGEYQLPGGSNYKELLITLPNKPRPEDTALAEFEGAMKTQYGDRWRGRVSPDEATRYIALTDAKENALPLDQVRNYTSAHFNEPNVLAHLRMNDREAKTYTPEMISDIERRLGEAFRTEPKNLGSGATSAGVQKGVITPLEAAQYSDARGFKNDTTGAREKILHLEEIQSDWHQTGKKHGYRPERKTNADQLLTRINELDAMGADATPEQRGELSDLMDQLQKLRETPPNVPDAPLKKDWPEMAFKRAVKYAADNGYDRITWTTGAQQAERYNLAKRIGEVRAVKSDNGKFGISVYDPNGRSVLNRGNLDEAALAELVGADTAKKIVSEQGQLTNSPNHLSGTRSYSGLDLEFGGEGMKRFYDDQLPLVANKVGKKYGAKYEPYELEGGVSGWEDVPMKPGMHQRVRERLQAHSLKLTPALRDKARGEGMPFMAAAPAAALPAASDESEPDADLASKIDALEKRGYADGGRVGAAAKVLDAITEGALNSVAKKRAKKPAKKPVVSDRETMDELARYLNDENPRAVIGDNGGPMMSYPPTTAPALAIDKKTGKEYLEKVNSTEALALQKLLTATQRDIDAGSYKPFFDVERRADVDPSNHTFRSTTLEEASPRSAAAIEKYTAEANDPAGLDRLRAAYDVGSTIPGADRWYFMKQLEDEFIHLLGPEEGRRQFDRKFATSMAATTGGSAPRENLRMAMYGNYLRENRLPYPEHTYEMPFPIGGRYAGGNMEMHRKVMDAVDEGGGLMPRSNPKRYNFRGNFLGDTAATIDEQMSGLFKPGLTQPPGPSYGAYESALGRVAEEYAVDPRGLQDVAWAGAKKLKDGDKYRGSKPMIQEVNEMIERTARATGLSPEEVVKYGIVGSRIPLYAAAPAAALGATTMGADEAAAAEPTLDDLRAYLSDGGE